MAPANLSCGTFRPMKICASDTLDMSVADRIRLVTEIWESIAQVPEQVEITPETRELLRRRLAEFRAQPTEVSPWSEVRARLSRH